MRDQLCYPCILVANGTSIPIFVTSNSTYSSSSHDIYLNESIHSPLILKNLLSINKLCRDNKHSIVFDASSVSIKDHQKNKLIAEGKAIRGLYQLDRINE